MARIAIKIGTSVLSNINDEPAVDILESIVNDIAIIKQSGHEVFIISSGATIWGKHHCSHLEDFQIDLLREENRGNIRKLIRQQIFSSIGQPFIMSDYAIRFNKHNIQVAQILVTRHDLVDQYKYERLLMITTNLLKNGIIPIYNENDVLANIDITSSDNDRLASILAIALNADKLILLTDIDGIFINKQIDSDSVLLKTVENIDDLYNENGIIKFDKGHIKTKLDAAKNVTSFGVEVIILNGKKNGVLREILSTNNQGTTIKARGKKLNKHNSWIAMAAKTKGEIYISTFLAEKVRDKKPVSILLIGVEKVNGNFDSKDVVDVKDMNGKLLGKGDVRISSIELTKIIKNRDKGIEEEMLGKEVIHRDYFVLVPE